MTIVEGVAGFSDNRVTAVNAQKFRYEMHMQARPVTCHYKGSRLGLILPLLPDPRTPTSSDAY